jgi:hypothetical protein
VAVRTRVAALAILFLVAHLSLLPPTLEDIDSINLALGVREFDVARHQPHPPGYPVFIAAAKLTTAVCRAAGVPAPEVRGLAVWSALAGAALIPLLFAFFRALGDDRRAWWATVVVACAPLFWFTALRPLSDVTGLAFAVAAMALLVPVIVGRAGSGALLAGAFLSTLAVGVRSQTFVLTLPLLAWALVLPGSSLTVRQRVTAVGAAVAGGLIWAIPLVAASGGLPEYMSALGSQAGEDFSGVVILWTVRSARVGAQALVYTFLWPWGSPWLGALVVSLGLVGALRVLWRSPRTAVVLAVAFIPYAAFHLLFHEIVTVRYALPLVIPVAYLFIVALDWLSAKGRPTREGSPEASPLLPILASALAVAGLVQVAAPSLVYARTASPAFRAFADVKQLHDSRPIGLHAFARRVAEWEESALSGQVLEARHGSEWLAAVDALRVAPSVLFLADPRRTDLALFDPNSLLRMGSYTWGFSEPPFVGGARPGSTDLFSIESPGWMLGRGWALTAEVSGVTERDGGGPHRRPSVGWIRSRPDAAILVIGGRHLGAAGEPPAEITVAAGDRVVAQVTPAPGFFVKRADLPAGTLAAAEETYVPLQVTSRAADGGEREVRVALEQFDVQSGAVPMFAFEEGWQEPEYNPMTAAAWRWMGDRSVLWVRPVGRDVTLRLSGESPLRYYDDAPVVRVTAGDAAVGEFRPSSDFTQEITLPQAALAASDGRVVITSDKHFVPGERDGSPDKRRLAIRVYRVGVR